MLLLRKTQTYILLGTYRGENESRDGTRYAVAFLQSCANFIAVVTRYDRPNYLPLVCFETIAMIL